jgi:GPI inositol-deacylase
MDVSTPYTIPLIKISDENAHDEDQASVSPSPLVTPSSRTAQNINVHNEREHLLLLMTWLLPLAAPILAVWVRTLLTAGFTTPFDGDHNFLHVLPFLVLSDPGWGLTWLWSATGGRSVLQPKWRMLLLAGTAFLLGARETYLVFEVASAILGVGVVLSAVRR